MSSFCVIGSGISGATIANLLNKKHTVDLYDKARGLGGRSSFKRLDNLRGFDHGTQYFSLSIGFVFLMIVVVMFSYIASAERGERLGVPGFEGTLIFLCLLQAPTILFRKNPDLLDG